jgi:hypothetical protein
MAQAVYRRSVFPSFALGRQEVYWKRRLRAGKPDFGAPAAHDRAASWMEAEAIRFIHFFISFVLCVSNEGGREPNETNPAA